MTATHVKPAQRARKTGANGKSWTSPHVQKYQLQWAAIFRKHGWANRPSADKKDLRHSVLEDLFGDYNFDVSAATEPQWDCIYLAQDFLLDNGLCAWNKATAKTAIDLGLRNRYIWNIENAGYDIPDIAFYGAPEEYIAAVAADKFGVRNWRGLDLDKLRMLLITIKNRVRKAAKKGRNLHTPTPAAASDDNCPF